MSLGVVVEGGGPDLQWGRVLLWHRPRGGDVEGSGRKFKTLARSLHHLPQIPTWVSGRSRHRYRHPRGRTA